MSTPPPEQRLAQFVRLNPSALKKYKEMHANVWPEVLLAIRECNIRDCKPPPPKLRLDSVRKDG